MNAHLPKMHKNSMMRESVAHILFNIFFVLLIAQRHRVRPNPPDRHTPTRTSAHSTTTRPPPPPSPRSRRTGT